MEAAAKAILKIDKANWTPVKFGDVAFEPKENAKDIYNEGIEHVVGLEHIEAENIHLTQSGKLEESTTFSKKFKKGDVLFGRRRAYLKKAALASFDGICSGDITVFRAKKNILPKLLPFIVNNEKFFDYAVKHSAGGLSPRVKFKDLANYEFLLPPKDQQAQLAELLWAMDEVIEREREVLEMLDRVRNLLSTDSIDFGYKSKILPKEWKMLKIKDFAKVQAGATPLRSNKKFFDGGTYPWIKTLDLNNDKIYKSEELITEDALKNTSCKLREKGTVLVAMYGGFNQIGRTGLLEIEAATNQALSAIMVNQNLILPEYLLLVLNTKIGYWKKVAISSRKDPNITKDDVENFPVPIPPMEVQKAILRKTNLSHSVIKNTEFKINNSKALQKSLINQIF